MPRLAKFCSGCQTITPLNTCPPQEASFSHETFASFREAASQGCFTCFTIWNYSERHATAWATFDPNEWRASSSMRPLIRLFHGPWSPTHPFFIIMQCEGPLSGINSFTFTFTPRLNLHDSAVVKK